ncbi:MAG TPA: cupin domain-containing protein [Usitatibacteraceae bacterium]|nr:cupin domain-containing protein [Usitatibacteraceae bacterium]
MNTPPVQRIRAAQVEVPCTDLANTLSYLTGQLGFHVESILPADQPTTAVLSGHGVRLRLQQAPPGANIVPLTLFLSCQGVGDCAPTVQGPDGMAIRLIEDTPQVKVPEGTGEWVFVHGDEARATWLTGRAGMQYRDLIPGRLGGRFIASQIRIPAGGPVPDYVHYHLVHFQMIYCKSGWVRVVYEDQGAPFVLEAGDCVLQPPTIRHRVLEASPGLEVIEVGCPAVHETRGDAGMTLPTGRIDADRLFAGQRFVRHVAASAPWSPWPRGADKPQLRARDLGIESATAGLAAARVVRADADAHVAALHHGELLFLFVLEGLMGVDGSAQRPHTLHAGDSVVIPAGSPAALRCCAGLELLEVALPA